MAGRGHVAGDRSGMLTRTSAGRVAIWVAVQRRAASYTEGRPSTLVQPEPIRTTTPRAANAVGLATTRTEAAVRAATPSDGTGSWRPAVNPKDQARPKDRMDLDGVQRR